MDTLGAAEVVRTLEGLALAHGPRFTPAPVLREIARTGETFHTD
jgi:3-hydroxyacyl-CoA dehydrogenase/enoyl-CoA hydratase/3-hydroxybutyryl-CoA epimerase